MDGAYNMQFISVFVFFTKPNKIDRHAALDVGHRDAGVIKPRVRRDQASATKNFYSNQYNQ